MYEICLDIIFFGKPKQEYDICISHSIIDLRKSRKNNSLWDKTCRKNMLTETL